jgi:AhpD family alkylhydroperoxidase
VVLCTSPFWCYASTEQPESKQEKKEVDSMEERLNVATAPSRAMAAFFQFSRDVGDCDLEPLLLELVKMRASQINGCAYCLDMPSRDARALGENEQRLYELNAWREAPFYTERERAALRLPRGTHTD